ncbi:SseB family protein [Actinocatenispora sera]|uniref:SseB protein N-terminal domain-containing protein n=1 Tax=Actinocatenispora sera TaxID=390989 RepID=A0A810L8R6_9ACTN|nr:SseB family protein [Actinocatenispora sera]BCJ30731.1 hypothetical protein Asera_48390 [Actinocatenispora sera]
MAEFEPVNDLERQMREALAAGDQEQYLRLLSGAELVLPVGDDDRTVWPTMVADERTFVAAYTSPAAMAVSTVGQYEQGRPVRFRDLVDQWPDPGWSLVVDPGLVLAAHLPASLIRQIAGGEFGVTEPEPPADEPAHDPWAPAAARDWPPNAEPAEDEHDETTVPTVMQKAVPPNQVRFYLDKGYDWVAGYVHRWQDTAELETVPDIVRNLGLGYPGSPFAVTDESLFLLRWTAYRAELYRPPLGATDDERLAEVPGGWVVEHPPFAGDGQVAGSRLTIPEYKIHSMRLPHQAEMWRIDAAGEHTFVAVYDADERRWLVNRELVGEQ